MHQSDHHGDEKVPEFFEKLLAGKTGSSVPKDLESLKPLLGPTGEFPDGRVGPGDEGEIRLAVGSRQGHVFLAFGKEIAWLGMRPADARALARKLKHFANQADLQR